jgi:hypothetical protein
MFNSYSSNNSIKINAISGTIVKNYRKSFIEGFHMKSCVAGKLLCAHPTLNDKPVVVLQVMLCGNEELLAEIMWKDDFNEAFMVDKEESDANNTKNK